MFRKHFTTFALLLGVIASFATCFYSWQRPIANWDIVPYAALAIAQPGMSDAELSQRAHGDVRKRLGDAAYDRMVKDDPTYAARVEADPAALKDTLKFYDVKPLYVWFSRLAMPFAGGNGADAVALVSGLSLALLVALMPWCFRGREIEALAILWFLMLAGDFAWWPSASVASPDTLAVLMVEAFVIFAVVIPRPWLAVAFALSSILARPDCIFLVAPMLAWLAWLDRKEPAGRPVFFVWSAGLAIVCAAFIVIGLQSLPWSALFSHTFLQRDPYPSTIRYRFRMDDYIALVKTTFPLVMYWKPLVFIAVGVSVMASSLRRTRSISIVTVLSACALVSMAAHYIVFPIGAPPYDRMFFISYPVLITAFLLWLQERKSLKV